MTESAHPNEGTASQVSAAPVRLCCGQRHHGSICPDGKVMCANCFRRFDVADLMVEDGETWDVCKECATHVVR